jgi:hypothetical protein
VVDRVRLDPACWRYAIEFLGGLIKNPQDLEALLMEWILVDDGTRGWPDLLLRMARGGAARSPVTAAIYQIILNS